MITQTIRRTVKNASKILSLGALGVFLMNGSPTWAAYKDINQIKMHYVISGQNVSNRPMLLLHANGGDLESLNTVRKHFQSSRKVIAIDSRGHGLSELGKNPLTYEQMAEDIHDFLVSEKLKDIDVIGISDGGILSLMIAMKYPEDIRSMMLVGANLSPEGAYPWAIDYVKSLKTIAEKKLEENDTSQNWAQEIQRYNLMINQPSISSASISQIKQPTLVMAGDRDVIKLTHTVDIYSQLPNAQLAIVPGATHFLVYQDPQRFFDYASLFFDHPFMKPDSKEAMSLTQKQVEYLSKSAQSAPPKLDDINRSLDALENTKSGALTGANTNANTTAPVLSSDIESATINNAKERSPLDIPERVYPVTSSPNAPSPNTPSPSPDF